MKRYRAYDQLITSVEPKQGTAEPSVIDIADVSCSHDIPDDSLQNGGSTVEEIIQRIASRQTFAKILAENLKRSSEVKAEACYNGKQVVLQRELPMGDANGLTDSAVQVLRKNLNVEYHDVTVAATTLNHESSEPAPEVRNERSVFEHINSNFRSPVTFAQNRIVETVPNGTGSASDARASAAEEKQTMSKIATKERNVFEHTRNTSYTEQPMQRTTSLEGNRVFPFSEKLRLLTTINKEIGSNMPPTVQPLRTGYDAVTSGRSLQQLVQLNASNMRSNAKSSRVVNGQAHPVDTQVIIPTERPKVDSNLIFPSVTPIKCVSPASGSTSVKNTYATKVPAPGFNGNTNPVAVQPSTVEKPKLICLDSTRMTGEKVNVDRTQTNIATTHLIGPFISTGTPPPNTYIATIRPVHSQPLANGLQPPTCPQLQTVTSPVKGQVSNSKFQFVLPMLSPAGIPCGVIRPPVSLTALERRNLPIRTQQDLICPERLSSSPDIPERTFRPVSPAKGVINAGISVPTRVSFRPPDTFRSLPTQTGYSISPRTNRLDRRGSVEEELADQSYECALRESAHSPDIERYLRCESPITVLSYSNDQQNENVCEIDTDESIVSPHVMCNVDSDDVENPPTNLGQTVNECVEECIAESAEENVEESMEGSVECIRECAGERSSDEKQEVENVDDIEDVEDIGIDKESTKKKQNSAMIRRLEPRLPSPVRETSVGDLYRDPSQLTREERALQRAMMQFSEMEMKEKSKEMKKKDSFKRRLRKRHKEKSTLPNDGTKQTATKVWIKKFKRRRLWFSQRRSMMVKSTGQEDNSAVISSDKQPATVTKKRRTNLLQDSDEQPKLTRKRVEREKRAFVPKPTDAPQETVVLPKQKTTTKPVKLRRCSSETCGPKETKKENVPEKHLCKRPSTPVEMGKKAVKRAKVEIEPLRVNKQEVVVDKNAKTDRTHRVTKTYMLVTAYQGFRDFKPVVLESRTRGKSKQTDGVLEGQQDSDKSTTKTSEFPLLVVESVNSKPIRKSIIAENEEVQQLVENSLKARGKWEVDDSLEENTNEDDTLREARKLNVNRNTGETILHKAARLGYHETVHHHIHQGIDPNAKDNAGWTPLHEACSRGKVDVVKVLAKYGADVNACSNDGIRPIHDAAEGGYVDVLRVLLSYGADPQLATYSGNSALTCTKDVNTRAFLECFLEDVDLRNPSMSATETEGCWEFDGSCAAMDESLDHTSGIFEGVPRSETVPDGEFELSDRPHLPTYNLPFMMNDELTTGRRNYVLLSDVLEHLGISRGALLKKAKRLDIREMPWSQFMAEIADRPLCVVPKHAPSDSSTHEAMAELVPINYNLRRLLNIRVESVHMT
ncbi:uncharacterized protein LOC111335615 isoform X2 [Stylophora pistillata]|uniref:uncharacterized protein LOC111335615 isoform X2 n=1 Tax=Stylophora pistillata TaxID=50429 RepID=UPI000C03B8ED|nr:uncharacterized protein LOC111335615 isoform X2 [Stylophora pistillata]